MDTLIRLLLTSPTLSLLLEDRRCPLPAAAIRHYDAVKRYAVINACQETKLRLGKTLKLCFRKRMWLRKGLRLLSLVEMRCQKTLKSSLWTILSEL
uniref:Uncharacterized protein n=1 Tax=Ditylenchus dipsaci TaxID=166011 RepID=A0A915E6N2_9BILA